VIHWILVYKTGCWSDSLNYRYDNTVPVNEVFFCNYHAVGSISLSPVRKSQRPRQWSRFSSDVINSSARMLHAEGEGYCPFGCDVPPPSAVWRMKPSKHTSDQQVVTVCAFYFWESLFFDHDEGGRRFLRNIDKHLQNSTAWPERSEWRL
jgi:hypothetical protein